MDNNLLHTMNILLLLENKKYNFVSWNNQYILHSQDKIQIYIQYMFLL